MFYFEPCEDVTWTSVVSVEGVRERFKNINSDSPVEVVSPSSKTLNQCLLICFCSVVFWQGGPPLCFSFVSSREKFGSPLANYHHGLLNPCVTEVTFLAGELFCATPHFILDIRFPSWLKEY